MVARKRILSKSRGMGRVLAWASSESVGMVERQPRADLRTLRCMEVRARVMWTESVRLLVGELVVTGLYQTSAA